MTIESTKKLK